MKYAGSIFFYFLICFTNVIAQPITPSFKGYIKELGSLNFSNDLSTFHYDNILHHRLESRFDFNNGFELQVDVRNRLLNGYSIQNTPNYAHYLSTDPGFVDMSWTPIDTKNTILHSSVDRFQLSYYNNSWEATLGRQRVNWGKTYVWNPNDLFNSYAFLDFDYEERPGTDALLVQHSWSYASSIQAGYKFGKSFDESVLAFMLRSNLGDYDIQFIAGSYFDKIVLGTGWSGYLKNAGLNGEISYFQERNLFFKKSGYVTASIGSDYMFSNSVYLQTELLYNGGFKNTSNVLAQLSTPPSANNPFIAETGYFINSSYPISPLTSFNLGFLGSFTESLFILIPQINYSLAENIDFLVLAQLLKGKLISEATNTPNILFFRIKWSY